MTKAETFYKVGENYYMNEGKKAKFKVIQPYVLSEIQKEFIRRFKEYLGVVVGDCDLKIEDAKNHILDLLACYVQSKKTESILFLVGMYGSGKSFLHKVIAALLGNMYLKLSKEMILKYNSQLKGKTCGVLEETEENNGYLRDSESKTIASNFKDWTDSKYINERKMFNDDFSAFLNTINFVILGNWTIPELHTRRYSYFHTSSEKVEDKRYWDEMHGYLEDEKNIYALFLELATRVSKFHNHSQEKYEKLMMPCKRALIKDKISNVQRYLKNECLEGRGLEGKSRELNDECNIFLTKIVKATVTPHTFKDELLNLNITAKILNAFSEYHLTYEQLKAILMKRQIIDDEDILYKEYKKKKMCENEDIPDGRDETIKLLKEENEKLKKELEELKKKIPEEEPEEHTPKLDLVKNENGIYEKKPEIPGQKEVEEWLNEDRVRKVTLHEVNYNQLRNALFNLKCNELTNFYFYLNL